MASTATRRQFLRDGARAATVLSMALPARGGYHSSGTGGLRLGLIGCGGRGAGAVASALRVDPTAQLVAVADAFQDRIPPRLRALERQFGNRASVPPERRFSGFEGYRGVLDSDVDVVILAAPPHFRPRHIRAALEAGVHVFAEKPMAVDAPGYRSLLDSARLADQKNLCLVSGFELRFSPAAQEAIARLHDGAIGQILTAQGTYNIGYLWHRGRRPGWTEMEHQMRNWYYFTWLSGDHIVEQTVHLVDLLCWVAGDKPPVQAWGYGGRAQRTAPKWGDIFDHHAVVYDFADGLRGYAFTRQQLNCYNEVSFRVIGSKGRLDLVKWGGFRFSGAIDRELPVPKEHPELITFREMFAAVRGGTSINHGRLFALSTMAAILGRMATHSGKLIRWEDAIRSDRKLAPERYAWDADPPVKPRPDGSYPHAVPGFTDVL